MARTRRRGTRRRVTRARRATSARRRRATRTAEHPRRTRTGWLVLPVALTAAQRNRLPRSAFAFAPAGSPRSRWRYPMPTRDQARRAGISEGQRRRILNNAKSRAAQRATIGSYSRVAPIARRRRGAAPAPRRGRRAAPYRRYRGRGGRITRGATGWKRKTTTPRRRRR
jgi:hypothetical protein